MTRDLFNAVVLWQNKTFPESKSEGKLFHLLDEIRELHHAILTDDFDAKQHEIADCFILLFGIASRENISYEELCLAIDEKLTINKSREWGTPDENGVIRHLD